MEKVLLAFIARMPDWAVGLGSVFVLIGLAYVLFALGRGANKFAAALDKEQRLHDLLAEVHKEQSSRRTAEALVRQLQGAVAHAGLFMSALRELRQDIAGQDAYEVLLRRVIEALAFDVRNQANESHRCGLWLNVEPDMLVLAVTSAGFPFNYAWTRRLDINNSVAGRSFRKGTEEVVPDVMQDKDFAPNPQSTRGYRSMVCIPIAYRGTIAGVITVDGRSPFSDADVEVCRTYARIVEFVFGERTDLVQVEGQEADLRSERGEAGGQG